MKTRTIAIAALGLWTVTILAGVYFFVAGQTRPGTDGRTAVVLQPAERDMILAEMRELLTSVQGVVSGLSQADRTGAAAAARRVGADAAADVEPGLMAKLPLEFKQLGMSVHQGFDELAAAIDQGEDANQVMTRLDGLLQRCVACHATYQLAGSEQ